VDLSIALWIGGMLFSLGIFAVKVGFGLGFGGMRWKGIFFTLSMYLVLFILIAMPSESLIKVLEPVLKKGPYLHTLMAMGMIIWGAFLLRNLDFGIQNSISCNQKSTIHIPHSALLLIPCPVCLTAMAFSTWAALNVIKLPSYLVGLCLGIVFDLLSLSFCLFLKFVTRHSPLVTPRIGLGFGMIGIGLYFLSSLFLPAKIEEAKGVYRSFLTEGKGVSTNDVAGIFLILLLAMLIGFFINKIQEGAK
jgi:predicted transporter